MSLGKHNGQIFNAGFENYSINQIALKVKTIVKKITKKNIQIRKEASDDLRSYNVNSDKIKKILKFKPQKTINNAIKEIVVEFEKGRLKDSFSNLNYFNVKKLKKTNLK